MDEGQRVGARPWWGGQVLEPAVCGHGFSIVQNKTNLFMAIQQCKLALIKVSHSASSEQSVNAGSLAGSWSNDPVFCPLSTGQFIHSHNRVAFGRTQVIFIQTNILFQSTQAQLSPLWLFDPESCRDSHRAQPETRLIAVIKVVCTKGLRQVRLK